MVEKFSGNVIFLNDKHEKKLLSNAYNFSVFFHIYQSKLRDANIRWYFYTHTLTSREDLQRKIFRIFVIFYSSELSRREYIYICMTSF